MWSKIKHLGKKVVTCPACQGMARVPIRPGKTLRVNCPRCGVEYDIYFNSAFSGLSGPQLKHLATKNKFIIILLAAIFAYLAFDMLYRPKQVIKSQDIEWEVPVEKIGKEV